MAAALQQSSMSRSSTAAAAAAAAAGGAGGAGGPGVVVVRQNAGVGGCFTAQQPALTARRSLFLPPHVLMP